jgi:hypothetical protein
MTKDNSGICYERKKYFTNSIALTLIQEKFRWSLRKLLTGFGILILALHSHGNQLLEEGTIFSISGNAGNL